MVESLLLPLSVSTMFLQRDAIASAFGLSFADDAVWVPMVDDSQGAGEVVGYVQFKRTVTPHPGRAAYTVGAVRPASDPPPDVIALSAVLRSALRVGAAAESAGVAEALMRAALGLCDLGCFAAKDAGGRLMLAVLQRGLVGPAELGALLSRVCQSNEGRLV